MATGRKIRSIYVEISTEMSGFLRGMAEFHQKLTQAEHKVLAIGDSINQSIERTSARINTFSNRSLLAGSSLATALGAIFVRSAMSAVEAENLFEVTFDKHAQAARAWSNNLAKEYQRNAFAIREFAGQFAAVLKPTMGIDAATEMSETLTRLAYDIESFRNIPIEEVIQKLQSGLAGELEPMRRLGVDLSEAALKAQAAEMGIENFSSATDEATKRLVRYRAILKQLADAQGDVTRTADSPANRERAIRERSAQLQREFGYYMLPVYERLLAIGEKVVTWLSNLSDKHKAALANILVFAAGLMLVVGLLGKLTAALVAALPMIIVMALLRTGVGQVGLALVSARTAVTAFWARLAAGGPILAAVHASLTALWARVAAGTSVLSLATLRTMALRGAMGLLSLTGRGLLGLFVNLAGSALALMRALVVPALVIASVNALGNAWDVFHGKYERFLGESAKRNGRWSLGALIDSFKVTFGFGKKDEEYSWIVRPKINTRDVEQVKATILQWENWMKELRQKLMNAPEGSKQKEVLGFTLRDAETYVAELRQILTDLGGEIEIPVTVKPTIDFDEYNAKAFTIDQNFMRTLEDLQLRLNDAKEDGDRATIATLEEEMDSAMRQLEIRTKYLNLIAEADDKQKAMLEAQFDDALADEEALTQQKIRNIERVAERQRRATDQWRAQMGAIVNSFLYGGAYERAFEDISNLIGAGGLRLPALAAPAVQGPPGNLPNITGSLGVDITVRTPEGEVVEIVDKRINHRQQRGVRDMAVGMR
jgi:hypothetical protein